MRALVLGGSQFVGRQIAEALVEGGHEVSIFNRGKSRDELPPVIERLRGDRDMGPSGLAALHGRRWDACVDVCGYTAQQVRPSAAILSKNVDRYVFVSAVSVYGDPQLRPVLESHPLVLPADESVTKLDGEMYGRLKVTCEQIVREFFGERATILRPQIVVGPYDPSPRYAYWVERVAAGGEMLAPGDGSDHLQVIDARDIGRFARTVIEHDLSGPFNLSGRRVTWAEFLRILGATNVAWIPHEIIRKAGVTEFQLPLYRAERSPRSGLMDVSNERAVTAGLTLTSPETTLRGFRDWWNSGPPSETLSREREAELIQMSIASQKKQGSGASRPGA